MIVIGVAEGTRTPIPTLEEWSVANYTTTTLVEALGLEPRSDSLQKRRSTIELHPHVVLTDYDYINEDISLYLPPNITEDFGAGGRNRTPYLVVTKHPLCLLSYTGTGTASGNRTRVSTVKKSYPPVRR